MENLCTLWPPILIMHERSSCIVIWIAVTVLWTSSSGIGSEAFDFHRQMLAEDLPMSPFIYEKLLQ
eukprot:789027-Amphidinium_carterae.1